MNKSIALLSTLFVTAVGAVTAAPTTVLLDFGYDATFRGVSVTNPDAKGNYWNSLGPGNYFPDLMDTAGNATTVDFGPDTTVMNTDSYNGPAGNTDPNGDLQIGDGNMPADSDYDTAALGALGSDAAVFDYIVGKLGSGEGRFQIQGLDPNVSYTLTFYGAHKYMNAATDGLTRYNVYDDPGYSSLVGTVDLPVGSIGDAHNRDLVGVIANISPAADVGIFYVEFGDTISGLDGYLNCMSVTFDAPVVEPTWAGYPKSPEGIVDTGSFLGWINVMNGDYVWSYDLMNWMYLPESLVTTAGTWTYIFKP